MESNEIHEQQPEELKPVEGPDTEIFQVVQDEEPEAQLALIERKAKMAKRYSDALNTILITQTFPEDWQIFDDQACLSSAGAERIARLFDIRFYEVSSRKETFTDAVGDGYRYVFEGKASMGHRVIHCQGVYSTRDKFLGYAKGEWRSIEDINEAHIRNAAYHIFQGNGVKGLLGLRGIPKHRFEQIMSGSGEKAKASKVSHAKGTQGGTSQDDHKLQVELGQTLIEMANDMRQISIDDKGEHFVTQVSEASDPKVVAKASCKALTAFKGKEGKIIQGLDSAKKVKGKRLAIAVERMRKMNKEATDAD